MVKTGLTFLIDVEAPNGFDRSSHHRHLRLAEAVDALFHVTHDANRRVPSAQRPSRVIGVSPTTPPQPCEQAVVGRVGVLVFIDDERSVLSPKLAQDRHPSLKVLEKLRAVVEQGQRPCDVSVGPRLVAQPVQRINDGGRVAVAANIRASRQKQIGRKALHVVKIVHVVQRFPTCQNLMAGRVNDLKVAQDLNLKIGRHVRAPVAGLTGEGVGQRVQSQRTVERHAVKPVHGVEKEGGTCEEANQGPVG